MRRLVLIKHSLPVLRDDVPAREWTLGTEGIARAERLVALLQPGTATRVFTSREPKAAGTARIVAEHWQLHVEAVDGLHEHERPEPGVMAREEFERRIKDVFARPSMRVFGSETASQARRRFTAAVMRIVTATTDDIVVVAHGTVITLFVAEATGVEPFAFWKRMGLPCAVTLTLPELRLMSVDQVESGEVESGKVS